MLQIKAAILYKQKQKLKIKKISHSGILKKGQILVKIYYSGICGSQIGEINGVKGKDPYLPHLLGHEGSGKILKTYKNCKKFKANDRVILHWQKSNGINAPTPNYLSKNEIVNAGNVTTFSNFAIISENRLTKIPINLSYKNAVVFGAVWYRRLPLEPPLRFVDIPAFVA